MRPDLSEPAQDVVEQVMDEYGYAYPTKAIDQICREAGYDVPPARSRSR